MQQFQSIAPEALEQNPFRAIGKDWMLVGVDKPQEGGLTANAMTASWGGLGVLWARPVVFAFIRPQRLTRELMDATDVFSLNFLDESFRPQLNLCGSKSGRDMDKAAACGLDVLREKDTPFFGQSHTAILCRKLYRQPFDPAAMLDPGINDAIYPANDHHVVYIGEIMDVLVRK